MAHLTTRLGKLERQRGADRLCVVLHWSNGAFEDRLNARFGAAGPPSTAVIIRINPLSGAPEERTEDAE